MKRLVIPLSRPYPPPLKVVVFKGLLMATERRWRADDPRLFETFTPQDFEDFLKSAYRGDYPGLRGFTAGGKDGSIDLVHDSAEKKRTIFQAKLISGTDAMARWEEEKKGLEKSLKIENGVLVGQKQYEPWANRATPVVRYIFCHTCRPIHCAAMDRLDETNKRLKADIEAFFRDTFKDREGLRHLAGIEVEVISGDMLATRCEMDAALRFRWFGADFKDLAVPVDRLSENKGFRAFLSNDRLPYYSRARFRTAEEVPPGFLDEDVLLDRLLAKDTEDPMLVIIGPGGIGKTRLALELCRSAQNRSWTAFQLEPDATPDKVIDLLRWLSGPVLLWVDYVETQEHLDTIAGRIARHNLDGSTHARIIATCRSSHYESLQDIRHGWPLNLLPQHLPGQGDPHAAHQRQIFLHIAGHIAGRANLSREDVEDFAHACHDRPVLAAFTLFLLEEEGSLDLRNLLQHRDFTRWVQSRSCKAIEQRTHLTERQARQVLGQLLALFPLRHDQFAKLCQESDCEAILAVLRADRLIERNQTDHWETAHDVIADCLLSRSLSDAADTTVAIDAVLDRAEKLGAVTSCIISFQRIREHPSLETLSSEAWRDLFEQRLRRNFMSWREARPALLGSSLLNEEGKLRLISDPKGYWRELADYPQCCRTFAALALFIVKWRKRHPGQVEPTQWPPMENYLDAACRLDEENFSIARALRYDFSRYREKALAAISTASPTIDAHYLLVAWLEAGGGPSIVREKLLEWLNTDRQAISEKASFVYVAWLDASAVTETLRQDIDALRPFLYRWLASEGQAQKESAQFVYRAWLNAAVTAETARQDLEELRPFLRHWLDKEGQAEKEEAQFIYCAWLDAAMAAGTARQDLKELHPFLRHWLNTGENARKEAAQFVYYAWLDAAVAAETAEQDLKELRPFLRHWRDTGENARKEAAEFIYRAWLDAAVAAGTARQDLEELHPFLRRWRDTGGNAQKEAAQFIYRAWLDAAVAAGSAQMVLNELKTFIHRWIQLEGREKKQSTQFIYTSWLYVAAESRNKHGEFVDILAYLDRWLPENFGLLDADFIYRALITLGKKEKNSCWTEVEHRKDFIFSWLCTHCRQPEALFLTKEITYFPSLPSKVVEAVLTWVDSYPDSADALWRISRLTKHFSNEQQKQRAVECASNVAAAFRLSGTFSSAKAYTEVAQTLVHTAAYLIKDEKMQPPLRRIFQKAIRHPDLFREPPNHKVNIKSRDFNFYWNVLTLPTEDYDTLDFSNQNDLTAAQKFISHIARLPWYPDTDQAGEQAACQKLAGLHPSLAALWKSHRPK